MNGFNHARHSPQAVVGGFNRFAHSAGPGAELLNEGVLLRFWRPPREGTEFRSTRVGNIA